MAAITAVNGVSQTMYVAGGIDNLVGKLWNNPILSVYDEYTVDAADTGAAGLVLSMGRVPKNAIVIGFMYTTTAQGAAMTADAAIGGVAATEAEAFLDGTAATGNFASTVGVFPYTPLTADSTVTLITAAQDTVASSTITLTTLYVMDV
jgi:hypothetical protein